MAGGNKTLSHLGITETSRANHELQKDTSQHTAALRPTLVRACQCYCTCIRNASYDLAHTASTAGFCPLKTGLPPATAPAFGLR